MRAAAMAGLVLVSCGGASREDWPEGRPRIDSARFIQQIPGQPFHLAFALEFTDTDGDLGGGRMTLLIDGDDESSLPVATLFSRQQPPIPLEATEGRLGLSVQINPLSSGDEVEIGFRLEDAAGERSNEPRVRMRALGGGGS